ncbi:MAG: lipopolysaccharide heptosyltransferase II [Planctomycetes bacterium]|jgi:lipopolysaccharide heptosyltransferase II|nr:lipopolysaccharide heptosyltransferase II [Planctomycetota bacterium]
MSVPQAHENGSFPRRVLVVRLGAIGDVVNALVFATAIKREKPDTHIGWVVHPLVRPLVEGHPSVDHVHLWKRGGGLRELRRLVGEVRGERYDLAVDLQRIQKSALLARFSGARRRLGYDRRRAKEFSWLWSSERIQSGDPIAHMVEHYLEFARHLGVGRAEREGDLHHLPAEPAAERWAEQRVGAFGAEPILLNLGATKPSNRWAPERWGELATCLSRESDIPLALVGGPNDRESADRALSKCRAAAVHDLVGKTDLPQLIALARRTRLFVTGDSGPMHIAAALGTPVVALFGAAEPRRTGPWGEGHRIVRERPECAPCGRRHCHQARHICMEDLTVQRVLGVARAALEGTPSGK